MIRPQRLAVKCLVAAQRPVAVIVTGADRAAPLAAVAATPARRIEAPSGGFQVKSAVRPALLRPMRFLTSA